MIDSLKLRKKTRTKQSSDISMIEDCGIVIMR